MAGASVAEPDSSAHPPDSLLHRKRVAFQRLRRNTNTFLYNLLLWSEQLRMPARGKLIKRRVGGKFTVTLVL